MWRSTWGRLYSAGPVEPSGARRSSRATASPAPTRSRRFARQPGRRRSWPARPGRPAAAAAGNPCPASVRWRSTAATPHVHYHLGLILQRAGRPVACPRLFPGSAWLSTPTTATPCAGSNGSLFQLEAASPASPRASHRGEDPALKSQGLPAPLPPTHSWNPLPYQPRMQREPRAVGAWTCACLPSQLRSPFLVLSISSLPTHVALLG
jgi:hypothetical protein